jgi:hypothetical protein
MGAPDPGDWPSEHVYRAFVADFDGAWTAVERGRPDGRCNFMFALLAMDFLEWCGRVTNDYPDARTRFVDALGAADPVYFALLPAPWPGSKRIPMFPTGREFLWVIFNTVRHGLAHRYVHPDVDLTDMRLRVSISGADHPAHRAGAPRPPDYLAPVQVHGSLGPLDRVEAGHDFVVVPLHPDVLFADLRTAADAARLATLPPSDWPRDTVGVSAADLLRVRTPP